MTAREQQGGVRCRVCGHAAGAFGSATVLGSHHVTYYRCERCGFVQTEEPYWLDAAYASAISESDVGLVSRNLRCAHVTYAVIRTCFGGVGGRYLDYGGGYGLLVRLLRDMGLDFAWHDRYCENLFARGLECPSLACARFRLVTAYEVFEHLVNPVAEVERLLTITRSILFTTNLLPSPNPLPGQWWYYAPEAGQHVALYTLRSLRAIAERFGLRLYSNGRTFHLLTDRRVPAPLFRLVTQPHVATAITLASRKRSLLARDYSRITGRSLG